MIISTEYQPKISNATVPFHKTIIIGTGFGGIAMAYYLQQAGQTDFIMLERADGIGGVWRDNQYPGCACDVQSHLYSFSFALNPNWSNEYSPQGEIYQYLKDTVKDLGITGHIRFNNEVIDMSFSEETGLWTVNTSQCTYQAQHVVGGFGSLSDPMIPNLPGLEDFKGETFHSATWNNEFDLTNKRVAVVGNGASALQFIPAIQPKVNHMAVFQRTPAWVLPRHDHPISKAKRLAYKAVPKLMQAERLKIYGHRESWALGFLNPVLIKGTQRKALKHLNGAIKDKELRKKLTPTYTLGCKRILISNTYYPALAQDNVEVVTTGIKNVVSDGIIGNDGRMYPVDAILFGTGFKVSDLPFSHIIHDKQGKTLAEHWQGTPEAYLGISIHGFPNLYLLHGPNTGLGHTSVVFMMEAQAKHIVKVIEMADQHGYDIVEPTAKAQQSFVNQVNKDMKGTVWVSGGCDSWYLDDNGKNSTIWPSYTFTYNNLVTNLVEEDYIGRKALG